MRKVDKRKKAIGKKIIGGALATLAITGAVGWWTITSGNKSVQVPTYEVKEVIDGDTFLTKEDKLIRLASIDSPEIGFCGGQEAKEELEKLILGKPLYVKILFVDIYKRMLGLVYTPDGLVNSKLLQTGWVAYTGTSNEPVDIHESGDLAKKNKLGIFGSKCTQETNPENPQCVIKGNRRSRSGGDRYYHFPGCQNYNKTLIQLYLGDEWFCTEKEAVKAGYLKASDCLDKQWK